MEDSLDSFAVDSDSIPYDRMLDASSSLKDNALEEPRSPFEWDPPSLSPMSENEFSLDDKVEVSRVQIDTLICSGNGNDASHNGAEIEMEDISENEEGPYDNEDGNEDDVYDESEAIVDEEDDVFNGDEMAEDLHGNLTPTENEEQEEYVENDDEYQVLDDADSENVGEQGLNVDVTEQDESEELINQTEDDDKNETKDYLQEKEIQDQEKVEDMARVLNEREGVKEAEDACERNKEVAEQNTAVEQDHAEEGTPEGDCVQKSIAESDYVDEVAEQDYVDNEVEQEADDVAEQGDAEDVAEQEETDVAERDDADDVAEQGDAEDVAEPSVAKDVAEQGNTEDVAKQGDAEDVNEDGHAVDAAEQGDINDMLEQDHTEDVGEQGDAEDVAEEGDVEDVAKEGDAKDVAEKGDAEDVEEKGDAENLSKQGDAGDVAEQGDTEHVTEENNVVVQEYVGTKDNITVNIDTENVSGQHNTNSLVVKKEKEIGKQKQSKSQKTGLSVSKSREKEVCTLGVECDPERVVVHVTSDVHESADEPETKKVTSSEPESQETKDKTSVNNAENSDRFKDALKEVTVQKLDLGLKQSKVQSEQTVSKLSEEKCSINESPEGRNKNDKNTIVKVTVRKRKVVAENSCESANAHQEPSHSKRKKSRTGEPRKETLESGGLLNGGRPGDDEESPTRVHQRATNHRVKEINRNSTTDDSDREMIEHKLKSVTFYCDESAVTSIDTQSKEDTPTFRQCSVRVKPLCFSSRLCTTLLRCSVDLCPLPSHLVPTAGHIKLPKSLMREIRRVPRPKRIISNLRHKPSSKPKRSAMSQSKMKKVARPSKKMKRSSRGRPVKTIRKVVKTKKKIVKIVKKVVAKKTTKKCDFQKSDPKAMLRGKRKSTSPYRKSSRNLR